MHPYQYLRENIETIEEIIGHKFQNTELLVQALTHRSYVNESKELIDHNERLEFLGDAILGFCVAEFLYTTFDRMEEGELSVNRSQLVDEKACAFYMEKVNLSNFILLAKGERIHSSSIKRSILADAFEAVLAAIYLDGGIEKVKRFLLDRFEEDFREKTSNPQRNYKADLQDYTQKKHQQIPQYQLLKEEGPDHEKAFFVAVYVNDQLLGEGMGSSKKEAERIAAKQALENVEKDG